MPFVEDIELIDLTDGTITLSDGTILPITDWFDSDGEDCEPDDAVMVVAGNDDIGWFDVAITARETVH